MEEQTERARTSNAYVAARAALTLREMLGTVDPVFPTVTEADCAELADALRAAWKAEPDELDDRRPDEPPDDEPSAWTRICGANDPDGYVRWADRYITEQVRDACAKVVRAVLAGQRPHTPPLTEEEPS